MPDDLPDGTKALRRYQVSLGVRYMPDLNSPAPPPKRRETSQHRAARRHRQQTRIRETRQ